MYRFILINIHKHAFYIRISTIIYYIFFLLFSDDKENLDQALFQNPTINLSSYNSLPFPSVGKLLKTEDEENNATGGALYYPLSESYMPDTDMLINPQKINFVYSLGEGGGTGQDWMVSLSRKLIFIC